MGVGKQSSGRGKGLCGCVRDLCGAKGRISAHLNFRNSAGESACGCGVGGLLVVGCACVCWQLLSLPFPCHSPRAICTTSTSLRSCTVPAAAEEDAQALRMRQMPGQLMAYLAMDSKQYSLPPSIKSQVENTNNKQTSLLVRMGQSSAGCESRV